MLPDDAELTALIEKRVTEMSDHEFGGLVARTRAPRVEGEAKKQLAAEAMAGKVNSFVNRETQATPTPATKAEATQAVRRHLRGLMGDDTK